MTLKPLQIGQLIITPKMLITLVGAFFILGIGIGVTVASGNKTQFALFACSILSIAIIAYTFLRGNEA